MNRTLKLSIMLALAVGGGGAFAQSLGTVQVRSTMDQPLLAEVPLNGVSGNPDSIHVALASEEAFSRAGLNRSGLPVELNFAVVKGSGGHPVIRITSSAPVRDTYLDFLVEVSSGGSSAIREVTMLLDPPGSPLASPSASPASSAKPSRTAEVPSRVPPAADAPQRTSRPAAPAAAAPAPAPAAPRASASSDASSIGPVRRGQTLSTLARENAGGADFNQYMVALQKANPDAFYRDNMNALKTGAVLRKPSADEVQAQSASAALAEIRRQNEAWRSGAVRNPSAVADGASQGASSDSGAAAPAQDRLAIVPAKEGGEAAAGRPGSRKGGDGDAGLRQELATAQETAASLKQQSAELKSRVGELEDINAKNQRLISLKDAEIAELQRKLAQAQGAQAPAGAAPAAAASAAPAAAPAPQAASAAAPAASAPAPAATAPSTAQAPAAASSAPASAATVTTAPLASTAPAAAPQAAPKPATPAPAPAPAPVAEDDPWYMQPWAWGAGAVLLLLLVALAVSSRRKRSAGKAVAVAGPSLADRFNNEPSLGSLPEDEVLDEDDDRDQREILDALSEHPDDIGLHLELVHLYFQRRDVERFETAAEGMYAHVTDPNQPEWREVVLMGEELSPTHPLFGGHAAAPAYDAEAPVGHDAPVEAFDLGTYVTTPEEQARPAARAPHSEYHFNFDLTPVQRNEAQSRPHAPDVFDVDAPESPYQEPATDGGSRFADLLADERAEAPRHEPERSTWSFADESDVEPLAPEARDTHAADTDLDRELHDLDGPTLARDEPHVDIRDLDEPRFDAPRLDEPRFDEPRFDDPAAHDMEAGLALDGFSDDPVDTKLDLARAYLDMGDAEGARLMLDEVIAEGSQMQKDTARRMLEGLA